jgi:hypothetical protein
LRTGSLRLTGLHDQTRDDQNGGQQNDKNLPESDDIHGGFLRARTALQGSIIMAESPRRRNDRRSAECA